MTGVPGADALLAGGAVCAWALSPPSATRRIHRGRIRVTCRLQSVIKLAISLHSTLRQGLAAPSTGLARRHGTPDLRNFKLPKSMSAGQPFSLG